MLSAFLVMCKIEGCQGKTVARGLCAKHYMRVRRTGDPAVTGKRGRPREQNVHMAMAREVWDENWSERTMARFAAATWNLDQCSAEASVKVWESCRRPNGTTNVSLLLERSIELWWLEHPPARQRKA